MKTALHTLASTAVLALLTAFATAAFGQSPTPSPTPTLNTAQQLAQSLGNFAITTPHKAVAANDTNDAANNAAPAAPQSAGRSLGDRAQERDRSAPRRENTQAFRIVKHVNALLGGFELGAGFGFGLELTTADAIPGIELRAKMLTSTRFYRRLEAQAYIPKLGSENTHLDLWFNYQYRTQDNFFGIGPRTPEEPETNFGADERSINGVLSHDFADKISAGIYARLANTNAYRGKDEEDTPVDVLFSGQPTVTPFTRFLPGLNVNAKIFSYGAFVEVDARNNEEGLPKGGYFYGRLASHDGLKNDIFDDFGWNEVELDGRAYIPVFSDATSVALRGYTNLRDPKRGSQIPFYELAWLGGRNFVRGFRNFRFRGNNSVVFSIEPRQTVWRQEEDKGLDVFAFGDAGQVWGDNRALRSAALFANDEFDSRNWRFGIGGGVQYRFNKSTAFRVDIGHSNERNMVYFSVSRGF
jgi:hypothetical protein